MSRSASVQSDSTLKFLTPAVPEDFLDRLQQAKLYYSADEYQGEHSHQPLRVPELPVGQDYWLNWRDRWQTELSALEEQDTPSPEDALS
jgi:hypothetical protein